MADSPRRLRVAILSSFPPHALPQLAGRFEPKGHYATWLPHLAVEFEKHLDQLDLHWIALAPEPGAVGNHTWCGQQFHFLETTLRGRASSLYRADRANLHRALGSVQPDFVHGWGNEDVYGLATATCRFPHVVGVQGLLSFYVLRTRMHPREWFQALVELYVLRKARHLVAESPWSCRMVARHAGGRPVHHVEYGVQNLFQQIEWNPNPDQPTAIFCGSADARKGIGDLIQAFQSPSLAHARLLVVGDDTNPEAMKWKPVSPANVEWTGRRPITETAQKMGGAWCFAMPTRGDTGPMAVKEARVVGLPVISSPDCGAIDYVTEGRNGFIVRPGDIPTLTQRLVATLSDHARCKQMGAFQHAEQRVEFSAASTARNFTRLYHELHATTPKRSPN